MNEAALDWLTILRTEIEKADLLSVQVLACGSIDEALSLIVPTDLTPAAAARAKDAVTRFRAAMANDWTGQADETVAARARAIQAIDTLATRVSAAPASQKAIHLGL